jgi:hypothetical protein
MTPDPFHGIHRGCKVIAKKQPSLRTKYFIDGRYCITHKVDLCRCGSEWSHNISEELRIKKITKPYGIRNNVLPAEQETV